MALTGLSSINGTTSAIEDKGLRDFISTASGSWTGGGGGSGPVTSTGGTTTYINKLNNMNLSASVAYASPNGALLDNVYNSGRSGYAASAYINSNVTANIGGWNNSRNWVTANSGSLMTMTQNYDSYNQPNFWQYSTSNIYGLKINSGNFSQLTVSQASMRVTKSMGGMYDFNLYFRFSKFIPKTATATYSTVQEDFFEFYGSNLHIIDPFTSLVGNDWGTTFGCLNYNGLYGTDVALNVWSPWTGYTGQEMYLTASFHAM